MQTERVIDSGRVDGRVTSQLGEWSRMDVVVVQHECNAQLRVSKINIQPPCSDGAGRCPDARPAGENNSWNLDSPSSMPGSWWSWWS